MSTHIQKGIETLKKYYIHKLMESCLYKDSEDELYSLTLSELELILKKSYPTKKNPSRNSN
ncbi:Fur-regulated basic protein FbpA [Bacillus sp. UNC438CL73TsuS30]|uniref:Fur-regulated basic protein FbpA n=1 Tax=Bacillus sp. UNC438CL73TsuS30 TaxID=1340434 RepID=UPI00047E6A21